MSRSGQWTVCATTPVTTSLIPSGPLRTVSRAPERPFAASDTSGASRSTSRCSKAILLLDAATPPAAIFVQPVSLRQDPYVFCLELSRIDHLRLQLLLAQLGSLLCECALFLHYLSLRHQSCLGR